MRHERGRSRQRRFVGDILGVTDGADAFNYYGDNYAYDIDGNPQTGTSAAIKAGAFFMAVVPGDEILKSIRTTVSSLMRGQRMHRLYRAGEVLENIREKEYRLPSGLRIDFIDFEKKIIYELKPNNPRAIRQGWNQLKKYLEEIERETGEVWQTVLDVYE